MKFDAISFDSRARVLVIGLGRSGRSSITVLRKRGAAVIATDESSAALADAAAALGDSGARFIAPAELGAEFAELDVAVVSPGVPMTSAVVRQVQDARVPVLSEIEVAYRISLAPIVAVTGTKGKTTTTALIGELFRAAGNTTFVGGNIGNPLIAETDVAPKESWVIAEVSSFQLESIRSFKPKIATILNISPDHLDRYYSMDEYTEAKFRVFANQSKDDTFIGNLDDERLALLAEGEEAARLRGHVLWFSRHAQRKASLYVRNERIVWAPPTGDPRPVEIMPTSEINLLGQHNVDNVLAAVLVGLAAGIDPADLRRGVRSFAPLAHRLQTIGSVKGITYIDDSKATNPGAVAAALEALYTPTILIAGGKGKRTDFHEMGRAIDAHVDAVILIGEAADEIAATVTRAKVLRASTMEDAVEKAASLAKPGDAVLLSPGCASFDMFASAEARGDIFTACVKKLGAS